MLRTTLAIGAGKLASALASTLHMGAGTNLPGKVARKIDPAVLKRLGAQIREQVTAISGTNGKTTTAGLLSAFLAQSGKKVIHNHLGANMIPGITAAMVHQSSVAGRLDVDYGVLEVDEASLKWVTAEVPVDRVVVTNFFRDQLDRYGELDTTAKQVALGIEKSKQRVILNADDPLVTKLGRQFENALYYGVNDVTYNQETLPESPVMFPGEVAACPACGGTLNYGLSLYGHLGHYQCRDCGFVRPQPTVCAERVVLRPEGTEIHLRYGADSIDLHLGLPGLFNVYNLLAAAAAAYDIGLPASVIPAGLAQYKSVFGRAEHKIVHGKKVLVMLIKNPVGASEVLRLVGGDPNGRLLIAINDNDADGRDISWLWDAMFEAIPPHKQVMVSGHRAEDMAVRLKYAGLSAENITVEPDLKTAVFRAIEETPADKTLYILPTYTCLLDLRFILP